ncbi:hypothetical protein HDU76_013132 [Blyttiomyces sp. JEL0837]|nr:hypothetical protein HDU76_013132 [Blyttiomyces sp. JEL0837]
MSGTGGGGAGAGKKLQPMSQVPLLPPVKGAFIMPEVTSKPILNKNGRSGPVGDNVVPLPALPAKESMSDVGHVGYVERAKSSAVVEDGPVNHPNIIFVLGGPGSGKGTQCARLAKDFNYCHLSTGDLLRAELEKGSEIGKKCGDLMDIILGLLRSAILENIETPGFLIDGFPRAMDQALEFEKTIGRCRTVLYFDCPLQTLEARLLERGKTSGRADDNIDTIKKRFKTFEEQSMPVIEHFERDGRVIKISSTTTIDQVYETTKAHFITPQTAAGHGGQTGGAPSRMSVTMGASRPATKGPLPPIGSAGGVGSGGLPRTAKGRASTTEPAGALSRASVAGQVHAVAEHSGKAWQNIVFVLGGPGCGKGTQCVRLAKDYNYIHLSAGDLLRAEVASGSERAKELDAIMKEGKIVPMEVTLGLLREAMERAGDANGFLIDGFPRQLDQAKAFEETVAKCKFVLFFDCPESLLEARLLKRGETSGRADDNLQTIKKRFKTFIDTSMPVIEYFDKVGKCVKISSEPPPDEVYQNVRTHFEDSAVPAATIQPITHNNVIFVLGTQCARLAKDYNLTHLSTGDLLRAELAKGSDIGKAAGDLMKEGKIVPMHIIISLLRNAIASNLDTPGFLIDGFPRAMDQAIEFEKTVCKARKVLFFNCPLDVLEARLLERGKTSGRADDNLETIRKRFKTFEEESLPVLSYFEDDGNGNSRVIRIESTKTVDEVYEGVKTSLVSEGIIPDLAGGAKLPFDGANIVFVLGGPGSGKGTQCDRLVDTLKYAHLSTGDLLRDEVKRGTPLGMELEEIMKEGKMVPLETTLKLLVAAMEEQRGKAPGYLVDGFPRTMEQAVEFEAKIGKCKFVLFFDAPNEVLTARLLKRGETSGRADDNLESIKKRLDTFKNTSMPVIEYFEKDGRVKRVLADGELEAITEATLKCFEELA